VDDWSGTRYRVVINAVSGRIRFSIEQFFWLVPSAFGTDALLQHKTIGLSLSQEAKKG
jgi:hypothetical protein